MIDFHTHIFPPAIKNRREAWLKKDISFSSIYSSPRAVIATAADLVQSMAGSGIGSSVALGYGWQDPDLCREHNDYLIDAHRKYGEKVLPFCTVQPLQGDASYYEIERCAGAGLAGIGELRPDMQGLMEKDISCWKPVMEAARKWDLTVLVHSSEPVGHEYTGKGSVSLKYLYRLIQAYSDVKIVLAHWGGGMVFYSLMPEVAEALANTFFDTAATSFLYSREIFSLGLKLVGKDKIVFGSDYPLIAQSRAVKYLDSLKLPPGGLEALTHSNAARLLKTKLMQTQ